jgi:hypothetical protein
MFLDALTFFMEGFVMTEPIGINSFKAGTKRCFSVFLAIFLSLFSGFQKIDGLGTKEKVETPDDVLRRIKFTRNEFPQVLDFFQAEKGRLEGDSALCWAFNASIVLTMVYLIPAFIGLTGIFVRL